MLKENPIVQLIEQAENLGLLNSDWTLECDHCQAVFPREYKKCPNCIKEKPSQNIQIDFEI